MLSYAEKFYCFLVVLCKRNVGADRIFCGLNFIRQKDYFLIQQLFKIHTI